MTESKKKFQPGGGGGGGGRRGLWVWCKLGFGVQGTGGRKGAERG